MTEGMILIDVALTTTTADRAALVELLRETVAGSVLEPGCLIYRATGSLDDPSAFNIVELWESEAAYLDHCRGAPLAQFREKLPACGKILSIERRIGSLQSYERKA